MILKENSPPDVLVFSRAKDGYEPFDQPSPDYAEHYEGDNPAIKALRCIPYFELIFKLFRIDHMMSSFILVSLFLILVILL